jgi:hypothetical protein
MAEVKTFYVFHDKLTCYGYKRKKYTITLSSNIGDDLLCRTILQKLKLPLSTRFTFISEENVFSSTRPILPENRTVCLTTMGCIQNGGYYDLYLLPREN